MAGTAGRLLVLSLALTAASAAAAWSDCSTDAPLFTVSDVTLEPSTIHPGDVANFTIKASTTKEVGLGMVQMVVHYAGMPIWTQLDSLCERAAGGCPIAPGALEVRYSQLFPPITPPGFYDVTLNGHSLTQALFCVKVEFEVVPPGAEAGAQGGEQQQALTTNRRLE